VLVLALCVSHLVQGITGFGAVVLALPLLTFFFPLKVLVPALVAVNFLQAGWFAVSERRHIVRPHARSLVLLSLAGLPLGWAVYRWLPAEQLKIALGVVVTAVALWNLFGLRLSRPLPQVFYHALNFAGGIAQGSLVCGGPFLVIYAARMVPEKSEFRATLSVAWTVLNLVLLIVYTATGAWQRDMVPVILAALPSVVFGTILGILLHDRIPQAPFRLLIFAILLLSGLSLLKPLLG
jgi:hypothetical protein